MTGALLAATGHMSPAAAKFLGWAVVIAGVAGGVLFLARLLGIGR